MEVRLNGSTLKKALLSYCVGMTTEGQNSRLANFQRNYNGFLDTYVPAGMTEG